MDLRYGGAATQSLECSQHEALSQTASPSVSESCQDSTNDDLIGDFEDDYVW